MTLKETGVLGKLNFNKDLYNAPKPQLQQQPIKKAEPRNQSFVMNIDPPRANEPTARTTRHSTMLMEFDGDRGVSGIEGHRKEEDFLFGSVSAAKY